MLSEFITEEKLAELLAKNSYRKPFRAASDRAYYEKIFRSSPEMEQYCAAIVDFVRNLRDNPDSEPEMGNSGVNITTPHCGLFPVNSIQEVMRFKQDGNRMDFEGIYFLRRGRLSNFALAELVEHKGEFMPELLNGIWQTINEPFWYLPAHGFYDGDDPVPRYDKPHCDIFTGEIGAQLCYILMLFGDEIAALSPQLVNWMKQRILERTVVPSERTGKDELHWFDGYNNWTPWCCANVALCALTVIPEQPERLAKLFHRFLGANDLFLRHYGPDGGCEEGPGYYGACVPKLMQMLEHMDCATGGAFRPLFSNPKLASMSGFIAKAHISGIYIASFSDSPCKYGVGFGGVLYHLGELTHNAELMRFAGAEATFGNQSEVLSNFRVIGSGLYNTLCYMAYLPHGAEKISRVAHEKFTALPDLQFFVLRETPEDDRKGGIVTLKGGHNAQSHNHNDLGHFTLFGGGKPVIIDAGTMVYDRGTFSDPVRYTRWCYSAEGHNAPFINGIGQEAGREYQSAVGKLDASEPSAELELAGAYPEKAGVKSLLRRVDLGGVYDRIETDKPLLDVRIVLYSPCEPAAVPGGFRLGDYVFTLENLKMASSAMLENTDYRLKLNWGEKLWKIELAGSFPGGSGSYAIRFAPVS